MLYNYSFLLEGWIQDSFHLHTTWGGTTSQKNVIKNKFVTFLFFMTYMFFKSNYFIFVVNFSENFDFQIFLSFVFFRKFCISNFFKIFSLVMFYNFFQFCPFFVKTPLEGEKKICSNKSPILLPDQHHQVLFYSTDWSLLFSDSIKAATYSSKLTALESVCTLFSTEKESNF
eukprot:TRINITY_DN4430_c0_g1_i1.p1 TRINITY_DN4430_c0_g1~~TRINITY_DN4430_c0_g1_i1.p1  ORF type:complete len:172 (+),score=8.72 TRINITY_DN4430_c0_g1_i1:70-585(+)